MDLSIEPLGKQARLQAEHRSEGRAVPFAAHIAGEDSEPWAVADLRSSQRNQ